MKINKKIKKEKKKKMLINNILNIYFKYNLIYIKFKIKKFN